MARFSRRTIGRARSQRRTNWICPAGTGSPHPGAVLNNNSVNTYTMLNPQDTTSELSKYVGPTLIRIRGNYWLDPIFAPFTTLSARVVTVAVVIYVAETPLTFVSATDYSHDGILFARVHRFYANADSAGTSVGNEHGVVHGWGEIGDVDVKAMRKLEDHRKLYISYINDSTSTNGMDVGQLLRCLIKE